MITYKNNLFGFGLIFRVHGSALWKAVGPALLSTGILLAYVHFSGFDINEKRNRNTGDFDHPYVIAAYVSFFSFLLTFRLNFAYQRYWEGCTSIMQMLSKWLDVATYCAAYHYQSKSYDQYRPPSFGEHPNLRNVTRERERKSTILTSDDYKESLLQSISEKNEAEERNKKQWWKLLPGASKRMKKRRAESTQDTSISGRNAPARKNISGRNAKQLLPAPRNFHDQWNISGRTSPRPVPLSDSRKVYSLTRDNSKKGSTMRISEPVQIPYPSLFLQEIAHLVSLMTGVALSTLRNDIPNASSPLVEYFPGQPLPPVNPDELSPLIRRDWDVENRALSAIYFLMGKTRNRHHRTLYNAARPFQIMGGVSDLEIQELQKAHGPYAKVALCSMYVQEFVSRESLNGSTGKIPGPLLSRITHVLSDGMSGYNQARKLAYNPFPYPHAQLTAFFTQAAVFIFPLLNYSFVNDIYLACIMNYVTVLCFIGINEVARELENPMHNVPNDLPLTTWQAQFNEALVTIYSGFHPDSFWEAGQFES